MRALSALFLVFAFVIFGAAPALANVMVLPIRVSFGPRDRTQAVTVFNNSDTTNTYRLDWKYIRLQEGAGMAEIPETQVPPGPRVPDMVRIAPRQIVIPAKSKQVVRLSLRRPADLPDGEYRAYLSITQLADQSSLPSTIPGQKGVGIHLGVNITLNVPVLVKQGAGTASGKLGKVEFIPPSPRTANRPALSVEILRQPGVFSPYGRVNVIWQKQDGASVVVGFVENAYIYPEIERRQYSIPLKSDMAISGGSLRVVWQGVKEFEGQTFDEKIVPVSR
ncbi:MAG TPA: hypothetical protein PKX87_00950 [Alphaproteobacteria bacterium]|nr:hypothetical protein [Alphaproteobacteria bacterium]